MFYSITNGDFLRFYRILLFDTFCVDSNCLSVGVYHSLPVHTYSETIFFGHVMSIALPIRQLHYFGYISPDNDTI